MFHKFLVKIQEYENKNATSESKFSHCEMLPWNARKLFAKKSMRWASLIWKQKNNQVLPIGTLPHYDM